MVYAVADIADAIKRARSRQRLSQRNLAAATGMTQSQISRFESGVVDLRLSSLIELARALDLEPMLIPRTLVPAAEALLRDTRDADPLPAYRLDEDDDDG